MLSFISFYYFYVSFWEDIINPNYLVAEEKKSLVSKKYNIILY